MNKIVPLPKPGASAASDLDDPSFRAAYMAHSLRHFLADQIRALRGGMSQKDFGRLIGKPQSVVSRLENEDHGRVSLQTLIDIAEKLDIALVVRFTDYPAFLQTTADFSETAVAPRSMRRAGNRPASAEPPHPP